MFWLVSIFAYGQTGSGKTHTMVGSQEDFKQRGLKPRSLEQIFDTRQWLDIQSGGKLFEIFVFDLLIFSSKTFNKFF